MQLSIVQAKQDNEKAKVATVAQFRAFFYECIVELMKQIYILNGSIIHETVKFKPNFEILQLDNTTWQWVVKELEE